MSLGLEPTVERVSAAAHRMAITFGPRSAKVYEWGRWPSGEDLRIWLTDRVNYDSEPGLGKLDTTDPQELDKWAAFSEIVDDPAEVFAKSDLIAREVARQQIYRQLPARRAEIVSLVWIDGLDREQVAELKGITRNAVDQHVREAKNTPALRTALRKALGQ
jgi:DNA-directed RNA polymerase specialized sigma24 family protein